MRFYLLPPRPDGASPAPGDEFDLPAEESRHLVRVMRARAGERVRLSDGRGLRLDAELVTADARAARLRVLGAAPDAGELAAPRLVLACGVVKGRRFEWLLEKAAELGAHAVQPLLTDHGEVDPREGKRARWTTVLASATKQSGRAWRPDLADPVPLADWLATRRSSGSGDGLFYGVARARGDERRVNGRDVLSPYEVLAAPAAPAGDLAWVVGPEGGWSDAELAALAEDGTPVRLGPHRLRTETAVAAGLALLAARREMIVDA